MNVDPKRFIPLAVTLLCAVILPSCIAPEPGFTTVARGPAFIEVSQEETNTTSGKVRIIIITLLDIDRNPVPGTLVNGISLTPTRAVVSPGDVFTDKDGKAVFTVNAVANIPGMAEIEFTADQLTTVVNTTYTPR